jgi:hypothetical protein
VHGLTGDPSTGPRDGPVNRRTIAAATRRERATLDDWRLVIDRQLESVREDRTAWKYLCLSTIAKPSNWARLADAPVGTRTRSAKHAPSLFDRPIDRPTAPPTTDEIEDFPL